MTINTYKVTVENSVNHKDGCYFIKATTKNKAIELCESQNNILNSIGWTEYLVEKQ